MIPTRHICAAVTALTIAVGIFCQRAGSALMTPARRAMSLLQGKIYLMILLRFDCGLGPIVATAMVGRLWQRNGLMQSGGVSRAGS